MQPWLGINEYTAVVELGSFTGAAKNLGVSTAHVSRSINALEKRLGVTLLNRSTRQVNPTPTGQTYYRQCRAILDNLLEANQAVSQLNSRPSGVVKITAPVYYGEQIIAPLLTRLLQQYPDIELDLQLSNHNVDLIHEGFDLAVRLGELQDSSLMARRISERHYTVVASTDYCSRFGQPYTVDELVNHNCLRGISDHWHFTADHRRKDYRVQGRWRCNSGLAVTQAAIDGMGVAQLPNYYTDQPIQQGKLMPLLEQHRPPAEGIWAVYPPNRHLSARLRIVIDFLADQLSPSTSPSNS